MTSVSSQPIDALATASKPKRRLKPVVLVVAAIGALSAGGSRYISSYEHVRDMYEASSGDSLSAVEKTGTGLLVTMQKNGEIKSLQIHNNDPVDRYFAQKILVAAMQRNMNISVQVKVPGAAAHN